MQRWPEIRLPDDYRAIFEPASGVLRSELAVETWIRLAREAGCAQLFNCPVSLFITMLTGSPSIPSTVNIMVKNCWSAPAPGSPACFRTSLSSRYARCSPGTRPMAVTAARITSRPSPASCPTAINITVFPAEDNELKIGKHNGGQPISTPQERVAFGAVASDGSNPSRFLRNVLPGIGGCLYGASCTYDNTVDEDFIIDTLPGRPDTLLITGLSGHGFKFAPVLGEIASQFAQGEASSFNLAPFLWRALTRNGMRHFAVG